MRDPVTAILTSWSDNNEQTYLEIKDIVEGAEDKVDAAEQIRDLFLDEADRLPLYASLYAEFLRGVNWITVGLHYWEEFR